MVAMQIIHFSTAIFFYFEVLGVAKYIFHIKYIKLNILLLFEVCKCTQKG